MANNSETGAVIRACYKWMKEIKGAQNINLELLKEFAAWLGDPLGRPDEEGRSPGRDLIINTDNPEVMKKIQLINGPNGHALLMVMKARQDD